MKISRLAMLAKKTVEAAWLNAPAYDLATLAAEALESAQLLQSPETAADAERLRVDLAQEELAYERLRVALESAKRGRRWQRSRVAELERLLTASERASETNFWSYVSQKDRADAARDDAIAALTEAAELTPEHAEALLERAREIAKAPTWPALHPTVAVYRARCDSMRLGLYATPRAARAHCTAHARSRFPGVSLAWIDDADGGGDLVAGDMERATGYSVAAMTVESAYDPDGDE
ncbi:hypothetical protein RM704_10370 [Streptomyces sp. DSM 3412]|uniref:Uncharacterized protein n=1 Tax=Streptomyces gottesmaniae TaxID=3075518 RepID=A0ABU2YU62_9ACTN|nr:hypothetical protein [Streptomyces sp. DSM 3412]MDT0567868.1 hypothetical protein [Streptomyces sp. DSM 3412]